MTPAQATVHIRAKAADSALQLDWTKHAKERLAERGLIMSDVLYVLKHGFVHDEAQPSTRPGLYKYRVESYSPNSGGRKIKVVVIPFPVPRFKVVTVMWTDEQMHGG